MIYSVKFRILCILSLCFLIHSSQADNPIDVLERIKQQLAEFKKKYENEQRRIREFVSIAHSQFQDEACYNVTIDTFMNKNDNDPYGNFNILRIEFDLALLLNDTRKFGETTKGTTDKQGCECEKKNESMPKDMVTFGNELTNRVSEELKMLLENNKNSNNQQCLIDSLTKTQNISEQIRNKLDYIEAFTSTQNEQTNELIKRMSEIRSDQIKQTNLIKLGFISSCSSAIESGYVPGVYQIRFSNKATSVYCDQYGRMLIQHNIEGPSDFFNRSWIEYRNGFGEPKTQYWFGLENLYLLTNTRRYELHVVMVNFENLTSEVKLDHFLIGDENDMYRLKKIGEFSGTKGTKNYLPHYVNAAFTTFDRDNDVGKGNCAVELNCGYWHVDCEYSALNEKVRKNEVGDDKYVLRWGRGNILKEISMYIKLH